MKERKKDSRVEWLEAAHRGVHSELIGKIETELKHAFPEAETITICHYFAGYAENQAQKIVLTIHMRSAADYRMHTVKLGNREIVEGDFINWKKCLMDHGVASHIFLRVERRGCGKRDRLAVVYEDAYTYYGEDDRQPRACALETAVHGAVDNNLPDVRSVERVIRQVFYESQRCLYQDARLNQKAARNFYRRKLRMQASDRRGVHQWRREGDRLNLRKDLIWLLRSLDSRAHFDKPVYLDAYDYVTWALGGHGSFPQTLIGRSHGDLHGRNIVVGIARGEAEFPLVFDYGDMCDQNALVWDYVKLETELKVRLLPCLYGDGSARKEVSARSVDRLLHGRLGGRRPSPTNHSRIERVDQSAFAYEFESLLARQSIQIGPTGDSFSPEPPGGRNPTTNEKVNRALAILLRIRQEAAIGLGGSRRNRDSAKSWRDEYNFALAVYGLCTAKFNYRWFESVCAMVSAGVACAQINDVGEQIQRQINQVRVPARPYFCYHVPLAHAHRLWASGAKRKRAQAEELLRKETKTFGYVVQFLQEYGLLLIEGGRSREALHLLEPLEEDSQFFGDRETLARVGRAWKDSGDAALEADIITFAQFLRAGREHPSWQFYQEALRLYEAAYRTSRHYYPGVNVATLAYMLGKKLRSRQVAEGVLRFSIENVDAGADRFWILASRGDASLLMGKSKRAAGFYRAALKEVDIGEVGMVQSTYNQLCRLHWALGHDRVVEALKVFKSFHRLWSRLRPGPFGNCDDAHR